MSALAKATATGEPTRDASPLLTIGGAAGGGAESGLLDAMLAITGAEGSSLREALVAWQREQDRLANRAWRRPGGMARPAGLKWWSG